MATRRTTATKSKTTTTSKTRASTAKTRASTAKPTPTVVTETTPEVSGPELKKKELVDLVIEKSGVKKKFAKPAVEAALAVLGEALGAGREVNIQPMGKIKINRAKEISSGRVIVAKIRQSTQAMEAAAENDDSSAESAKDTVADAAE